jgi:hypothetical protein
MNRPGRSARKIRSRHLTNLTGQKIQITWNGTQPAISLEGTLEFIPQKENPKRHGYFLGEYIIPVSAVERVDGKNIYIDADEYKRRVQGRCQIPGRVYAGNGECIMLD